MSWTTTLEIRRRVHRPCTGMKNGRALKEAPAQLIVLKRLTSGANRDRTDDLLLAKQALSQLSYGPEPAKIVRSRLGW